MSDAMSKQFMPNYVTNVVSFAVTLLTGLYLTSFYTDVLGIAAYGLIPLATSVTEYIVIVSSSMSSAISRYITVAITRGDTEDAVSVFSTAKYGLALIVLAIVPIALIVSYLSPQLFNIPDSCSAAEVQIMFLGVIGASLLTTSAISNSSVLYAKNRLDQQNYILISTTILRVALILITLTFLGPDLSYVGVSTFVAAVVYYLLYAVAARRSEPWLRADRKTVSLSQFRSLGSLGGWNIVNSIGGLLFIQMSLILTNKLINPDVGGALSVLIMVVTALITFASTLTNLFTPITYSLYSEGKYDEMLSNIYSAMKVSAVLLASSTAIIVALGPQIMTVWMGAEYVPLADHLFVLLMIVVATGVASPKWALSSALLKPGRFGIVTLFTGALNVLFAYIFVEVLGMGMEGIILALVSAYVLKDCIINPYLYTTIVDRSWNFFYIPTLFGFLSYLTFNVLAWFSVSIVPIPDSLIAVILAAGVMFLAFVALAVKFFLSEPDKSKIRSCLPSKLDNGVLRWMLR